MKIQFGERQSRLDARSQSCRVASSGDAPGLGLLGQGIFQSGREGRRYVTASSLRPCGRENSPPKDHHSAGLDGGVETQPIFPGSGSVVRLAGPGPPRGRGRRCRCVSGRYPSGAAYRDPTDRVDGRRKRECWRAAGPDRENRWEDRWPFADRYTA